ncbi:PH domain-containing protein [Methylophilus aquaticus]|uniref:PH domain-containing protein n=1 Tax=Methylophilus aquaticus TaxID=1971610 RepID=A0ABT9JS78_9PROT|nr:PH domain-containing protein [Methylophilus aquaticus]MDP8567381.1 PH domain-containing protein [Methylophilus aquaticus]
MSFIDNNLLASETVIYRARLHWIIFINAALYLLLSVALSVFILLQSEATQGLWYISLLSLALALGSAISSLIRYKTSEFAITNKRVLIKVGFIRRHSLEVLLHKVEGIGVNQSIPGRIFGFGTIIVSGTGGTKETFDLIASPLEFRKQVQAQLS